MSNKIFKGLVAIEKCVKNINKKILKKFQLRN